MRQVEGVPIRGAVGGSRVLEDMAIRGPRVAVRHTLYWYRGTDAHTQCTTGSGYDLWPYHISSGIGDGTMVLHSSTMSSTRLATYLWCALHYHGEMLRIVSTVDRDRGSCSSRMAMAIPSRCTHTSTVSW